MFPIVQAQSEMKQEEKNGVLNTKLLNTLKDHKQPSNYVFHVFAYFCKQGMKRTMYEAVQLCSCLPSITCKVAGFPRALFLILYSFCIILWIDGTCA